MFRTICYAGLAGVAIGAAYKIYNIYFASAPIIAPPEVEEEELIAAADDNPPEAALPSVNVQSVEIPPVDDVVEAAAPVRTKKDQWHDKRRERVAKQRAKKAARDAAKREEAAPVAPP